MPLVIQELITTVEKPQGADAANLQVVNTEKPQADTWVQLELMREREARLRYD